MSISRNQYIEVRMQPQSNPDLFKALVAALPLSFLEGMARAVPAIYAESLAELKASTVIDEIDAMTVLPHYRRAMFETRIRREALSAGLTASVEDTKNQTATFSFVTFGQFVMTASYVAQPNHQTRFAAFRSEHAALNELLEQGDLYGFGAPSAEKKIYCILLHGGVVGEDKITTFMEFAFPSPTESNYVDRYCFAEVLAAAHALKNGQAEDQLDKAFPVPKQQPKEGSGNGGAT